VADRIDGVLLALHGAMATESREDPETDLVRAVRWMVGRDIRAQANSIIQDLLG
jgi:microcystin degradation protein MlrC